VTPADGEHIQCEADEPCKPLDKETVENITTAAEQPEGGRKVRIYDHTRGGINLSVFTAADCLDD